MPRVCDCPELTVKAWCAICDYEVTGPASSVFGDRTALLAALEWVIAADAITKSGARGEHQMTMQDALAWAKVAIRQAKPEGGGK